MNDQIREKETKKIKEQSHDEMWNELKNQLITTIDEKEGDSDNFMEIIGLPANYGEQNAKKTEKFIEQATESVTKSGSVKIAAEMADSFTEFIVFIYRFGVLSGAAQSRQELQVRTLQEIFKKFGGEK